MIFSDRERSGKYIILFRLAYADIQFPMKRVTKAHHDNGVLLLFLFANEHRG